MPYVMPRAASSIHVTCSDAPGNPPILVADATRARDLLGWAAKRSDLSTIIADAWHWHKRRFER